MVRRNLEPGSTFISTGLPWDIYYSVCCPHFESSYRPPPTFHHIHVYLISTTGIPACRSRLRKLSFIPLGLAKYTVLGRKICTMDTPGTTQSTTRCDRTSWKAHHLPNLTYRTIGDRNLDSIPRYLNTHQRIKGFLNIEIL